MSEPMTIEYDEDCNLWGWFGTDVVRAERRGKDFLILKKRNDSSFEIEHRWVDNFSSLNVLGQTFCTLDQKPKEDVLLFEQMCVWY